MHIMYKDFMSVHLNFALCQDFLIENISIFVQVRTYVREKDQVVLYFWLSVHNLLIVKLENH